MPIQLPKFFGPEQEQRLQDIGARKEAIEQERDEQRDSKTERIADGDLKGAEAVEAKIGVLDREEAELELEEAKIEAYKEIDKWVDEKGFRENLAVAEIIAMVVPEAAAACVALGVGGLLEVFEKSDATHVRYRALVAKQRRNAFKAYLEAEFTEEQAMRLVEIEAQVSPPLKTLSDNLKIKFNGRNA